MSTRQHNRQVRLKILTFMAISTRPVRTSDVSNALDISLYQARYYLQRLALAGKIHEIKRGKGNVSSWSWRRDGDLPITGKKS
ncbi:FaeA/PapI family transcriptional regulator [Aeromonas allosaccharophila]|uniref:FaeA/PapI family transcriptional regulator n=1 Tax=Aeromonas allosaccharophila TaxID=656 RepID=UPI002AE0863C|nr:FaeA/PapI family transcriptional regulator [Aeromonas allosaccharophila]